jgi:hypothetical protein
MTPVLDRSDVALDHEHLRLGQAEAEHLCDLGYGQLSRYSVGACCVRVVAVLALTRGDVKIRALLP